MKQLLKSVVRQIRTLRSVGAGGGQLPPATRWAISNDRPYRDLTEQCGHKTFQISGFWADYGLHGNNQISGEAQDVLWKLEERKVRSSSPGEFHPEALTEPCVNLSIHTALHS